MKRFGKTYTTKENFYAVKGPIRIWNVDIDNIFISKLVKTKTKSKYLIEYLAKDIRPIKIPKITRYVKKFKVEDKISKLIVHNATQIFKPNYRHFFRDLQLSSIHD